MIKIFLTDLKVSKAPEVKISAGGKTYSRILASAYAGKDKDGNSEYVNVNVTLFGKSAERSAELQKGSMINVYGSCKSGHYMRNDGTVATFLEVTADTYERPLGSRSAENGQQERQQEQKARQAAEPAPDEDLPF